MKISDKYLFKKVEHGSPINSRVATIDKSNFKEAQQFTGGVGKIHIVMFLQSLVTGNIW